MVWCGCGRLADFEPHELYQCMDFGCPDLGFQRTGTRARCIPEFQYWLGSQSSRRDASPLQVTVAPAMDTRHVPSLQHGGIKVCSWALDPQFVVGL
jgi:hypothetical protein